jgi:glycosyltransferase involved in cell wall biosynthesis
MKPSILFCLHLPPPIHGSSKVGEYIFNSNEIKKNFNSVFVNLLASDSISKTGKFSSKKLLSAFNVVAKVLYRCLTYKRPDLVYYALTTTGLAYYRDFIVIIILKLFGNQIVYHLHNKGISKYKSKGANNFLYEITFKRSRVILLAPQLYTDIKDFVAENQTYYCPNGIPDHGKIKKGKPKLVSSNVNILFLSNLIESKGVLNLVDALELLNLNGVGFSAVFAGKEGDITKGQFNEYLSERNLTESVKFIGEVYGNEKEEVFLNADIFVFPTYYEKECFPLVILEAMSFGLPVVTTFEGGIQEMVDDGKTGYLVQQKNVRELASKIEILIKKPDIRYKFGVLGFEKFKNSFTLDKFETNMITILHSLISKSS